MRAMLSRYPLAHALTTTALTATTLTTLTTSLTHSLSRVRLSRRSPRVWGTLPCLRGGGDRSLDSADTDHAPDAPVTRSISPSDASERTTMADFIASLVAAHTHVAEMVDAALQPASHLRALPGGEPNWRGL